MDLQKLKLFVESNLEGRPIEVSSPVAGWKAVEVLWPLNELFRPKFDVLKKLSYDKRHERAADKAIDRYVASPTNNAWDDLAPTVLRVLYERHIQFIMVCCANELENNPLTSMPSHFSDEQLRSALMLFGMTKMKLPYEINGLSASTLPTDPLPPPRLLQ